MYAKLVYFPYLTSTRLTLHTAGSRVLLPQFLLKNQIQMTVRWRRNAMSRVANRGTVYLIPPTPSLRRVHNYEFYDNWSRI